MPLLFHCRHVCSNSGRPPGDWAGGRRSHVARLCLTWSLIASSPIWDTNGDIRTLHTGHPVIGTSTWTISHQPRPMNITWRLISPHSHSWVTSKIGPVSLNTHRSTVCIQNSLPSWGSQFWWLWWETILHPFLMARSQATVTATLMNGHQMPRSLLTWSHHANKCPASPPGHLITSTHWQPICLWPGSCHHIQHSSNIQESQNCQKLTQLIELLS